MPRRRSTVGATSRSDPPARRAFAPASTATKGTGLVVWAVCTPPVSGIDHHLAVAVVGRDEDAGPRLRRTRQHPVEAPVHRLHRLDDGRQHPGVPHHVRVGVVAQDEVVPAGLDASGTAPR